MLQSSAPERTATSSAAALYLGRVMHARMRPVHHRFAYRVMNLLIDLDRLDEADRQSRLFASVFSFHESDHGNRDGASLSNHVRRLAEQRDVDLSGGRILLLCYPRLFGYVFNPLSIYFCYGNCGNLALLIYEVRNTFGEIHSYILSVEDPVTGGAIRQCQAKGFYVSPFMEMQTQYRFSIAPPDQQVKVRIVQSDEHGVIFTAAFSGQRRPLTSRSLSATLVTLPLLTFKVVAAIHWEAIRLWLKNVPYVPRPNQR
jgi:DUF1365 family protein